MSSRSSRVSARACPIAAARVGVGARDERRWSCSRRRRPRAPATRSAAATTSAADHQHPVVAAGELAFDHDVAAGRREGAPPPRPACVERSSATCSPWRPCRGLTTTGAPSSREQAGPPRSAVRAAPPGTTGTPASSSSRRVTCLSPAMSMPTPPVAVGHRRPGQPPPGAPAEPEQAQVAEPFDRDAPAAGRRDDRARCSARSASRSARSARSAQRARASAGLVRRPRPPVTRLDRGLQQLAGSVESGDSSSGHSMIRS